MHTHSAVLVFFVLLLAGCGGNSSNGDEGTNTSKILFTNDTRISTIRTDANSDGSIEGVTQYEYDNQGRLLKTTNRILGSDEEITQYNYADGNLSEVRSPSGDTINYYYDNGLVVQKVKNNNNQTTSDYSYDGARRLKSVSGYTEFYDSSYCANFTLNSAEISSPQVDLIYDASRLVGFSSNDGVFNQLVEYDSENRISKTTGKYSCDDSITVTEFEYNNTGQLVLLRAYEDYSDGLFIDDESIVDITYDDNGIIQTLTLTDEVEIDTLTYTTNSDTLITSIMFDRASLSGFGSSGSLTLNIEYQNERCAVAATNNPESETLAYFIPHLVLNPLMPSDCLFPLDTGQFD